MKQFIITRDDLEKYMGKENYLEFIDELQEKYKIPTKTPIWIIGEYDE